jgi:hypothetical protein
MKLVTAVVSLTLDTDWGVLCELPWRFYGQTHSLTRELRCIGKEIRHVLTRTKLGELY